MGEFFLQHFFAMDREEMTFNRAERSCVYRAAGSVIFVAHSCCVPEPRRPKRFVQDDGKSIPLDMLYPHQAPRLALERGAA